MIAAAWPVEGQRRIATTKEVELQTKERQTATAQAALLLSPGKPPTVAPVSYC